MPAVLAFITWAIATIPTITSDVGIVVSLVQGARAALADIQAGTTVTPDEVAALETQVVGLEATWAAELAAAQAAQGSAAA